MASNRPKERSHPAPAEVMRLVHIHVTRYENRIASHYAKTDRGSVNLAECEDYLAIWRNIYKADGKWALLNERERSEIMDAISSGE